MSAAKKIHPPKVPVVSPAWNNRILVVDDEKAVADSYRDILTPDTDNVVDIKKRSSRVKQSQEPTPVLEEYKFELTVVYNSEQALSAIKEANKEGRPFSLGFFDVKLGFGMDGVELVREIYKQNPDLFAVFVTAHNDRTIESIQKVLGQSQANQWDYLNKPFSRGEIIQKARNFTSLWNLNHQRKQHEQQIQTLHDKLLESERMTSVSAVARGVGHEFGNILMQIMGKAELSLNKDAEGMRLGLEKVVDASSRAMEILDRFKDLTNVGDVDSYKDNVSVTDIISGTVDLMEHQINVSQLKLNVVSSQPCIVKANSTSLMQVFVNLIINAIHAMGNNGQLDIHIEEKSDFVVVQFRDYGPGIKAELLYKVTEPLFSTKGENGTGLGLSICKEIVEIEHKGRFELSNHSEKNGLVITVSIPKSTEVKDV